MNIDKIEEHFNKVSDTVFAELTQGEEATIALSSEKSLFTRINNAKIRQISGVEQGYACIDFIKNDKSIKVTIPFCHDAEQDKNSAISALKLCRAECKTLPDDPFIIRPENHGSSRECFSSSIPSREELIPDVLSKVGNLDFAGLITSGPMLRASNNSKGQRHWFSSESFIIDFSIYSPDQKAVKQIYAGRDWNYANLQAKLQESIRDLNLLSKAEKKLTPGKYRCYFAPQAAADLISILSWGAINMRSLQEGECPLKKLFNQEALLSPLFSLAEDFSLGIGPKFNDLGEISSDHLPLISNGKLENMLTSSRTAKEYKLASNNANTPEALRSPVISPGSLVQEKILQELDTGIYISNVHYLNWSDRQNGRITGMTRYACFWVENGEIKAPISDMRFDETLYHFLGSNLVSLTAFREMLPDTSTYNQRNTGGIYTPGLLVNDFNFTL